MSLKIGGEAPDFTAETTEGTINFHEWIGDDWCLLLARLVASLFPRGPYPVLVLNGEQGSAKSTVARLLRALIDPNAAPLRSEPRETRDLMIAAQNSWVLSFDNISCRRIENEIPNRHPHKHSATWRNRTFGENCGLDHKDRETGPAPTSGYWQ